MNLNFQALYWILYGTSILFAQDRSMPGRIYGIGDAAASLISKRNVS
jgi:hypothetical protein